MDRFAVERAVLAGVSMGAHTALRLALQSPARVGGLVVITPGYDPATGTIPAGWHAGTRTPTGSSAAEWRDSCAPTGMGGSRSGGGRRR